MAEPSEPKDISAAPGTADFVDAAANSGSPKKVVLCGGAGLVGQNLVIALKSRGGTQIVVIDKHRKNLALLKAMHPDVVTVEADLSLAGLWEEALVGADCCVILQAQIGGHDSRTFARNNVRATELILTVLKREGVPYTVYVSSSVVEARVQDVYSESKREGERRFLESGLLGFVFRPTLLFGPLDRKHLGWLGRWLQRTPVFPLPNRGRYLRQPLYVGDFCRLILRSWELKKTGAPLLVAGKEKIFYRDIILALKQFTGARCLVLPLPYGVFFALLALWGLFDSNPPFTTTQLKALVAGDEFPETPWEEMFGLQHTPFLLALEATLKDPVYGKVVLGF